jgi:hypothetical protein
MASGFELSRRGRLQARNNLKALPPRFIEGRSWLRKHCKIILNHMTLRLDSYLLKRPHKNLNIPGPPEWDSYSDLDTACL